MLERDMQNLVRLYPEELLGEAGLTLHGEEVRMGDFRFDLVFQDRQGATLLVELQRGRLDRTHLYKVLDYSDRYRERHPGVAVECMVVANEISGEYKERLQGRGIDFRELTLSRFAEFAREKGYVLEQDRVAPVSGAQVPPHPAWQPPSGREERSTSQMPPPPPAPATGAPRVEQFRSITDQTGAIRDPQSMLKREYVGDPTAFVAKAEFQRRYPRTPQVWIRNFYAEMGFPLPAKASAADRDAASAAVIAEVRRSGAVVATIPMSATYGVKVTLDNAFNFGAARFQIGFVLSCLVFGWLDDNKGKLAELGVATDHFYDLERRYPVGERRLVVPGLWVEGQKW